VKIVQFQQFKGFFIFKASKFCRLPHFCRLPGSHGGPPARTPLALLDINQFREYMPYLSMFRQGVLDEASCRQQQHGSDAQPGHVLSHSISGPHVGSILGPDVGSVAIDNGNATLAPSDIVFLAPPLVSSRELNPVTGVDNPTVVLNKTPAVGNMKPSPKSKFNFGNLPPSDIQHIILGGSVVCAARCSFSS